MPVGVLGKVWDLLNDAEVLPRLDQWNSFLIHL